jgi:hypothetical protein
MLPRLRTFTAPRPAPGEGQALCRTPHGLKVKGDYELWMPDCEVPSAGAIVNRAGERWRE